ncbi:MAG: ABC transporter permease [Coriobacteriia bacterium]|nr:ABC transporter permease [Coriobacteriia bacterium]
MSSFLTFGIERSEQLATAFGEHIVLVVITLLVSVVLAAALTAALRKVARIAEYVQAALSALYSVPSLALFVLCIPLLGIGRTTAIVVLVAYNQFLLVRNFTVGLNEVDPGLVEAAQSLGMSRVQTFLYVQLPTALPVFIAGIRLATISTIGIASIAAVIDAGGLGVLLFSGLRTRNLDMLLWGTLLAGGLALAVNAVLSQLESRFTRPCK